MVAVEGAEGLPGVQADSSVGGQGSSVLKLSINVRLSEVAISLTVDKLDASVSVAQGDLAPMPATGTGIDLGARS